jgi:hypothetical protein
MVAGLSQRPQSCFFLSVLSHYFRESDPLSQFLCWLPFADKEKTTIVLSALFCRSVRPRGEAGHSATIAFSNTDLNHERNNTQHFMTVTATAKSPLPLPSLCSYSKVLSQ